MEEKEESSGQTVINLVKQNGENVRKRALRELHNVAKFTSPNFDDEIREERHRDSRA